MRFPRLALYFILFGAALPVAAQEIYYEELPAAVIDTRLHRAEDKNEAREQALKGLFEDAGCQGEQLSEQKVKTSRLPNIICEMKGSSESVIVVAAHFDKVSAGHGIVDNWSGAALLPTLYQSLHSRPRRLTFRFIGFTDEEKGLYGSTFYVHALPAADRAKIVAMVNIDSLGLSSTKVWVNRADKNLLAALLPVANSLNVPVSRVDVDQVGDSDSHAFAEKKIPVIDFHSITQNTFPVLHSNKDDFPAMQPDDYYNSYRLLVAYLAYLDEKLDAASSPMDKNAR